MSREERPRVAVLGGGVAGLSAAWRLAERGLEVNLLERNDEVGGLCRTVRRDAFAFDVGGHRFFTEDREVLDAVMELVGDEMTVKTRRSIIKLCGRDFTYPLDFAEVLRRLSPGLLFQAGVSYARASLGRHLRRRTAATFESWVASRYGRTLYDLFFAPYTRKLWGIPPCELSADWAAQRITVPSLPRLVFAALGLDERRPRTLIKEFYYPRQGIGRIPEALARRLLAAGGRILTGATVSSVRRAGGWQVSYQQDGGRHELAADRLVVTVPLPAFCRMVDGVPAAVVRAASRLRFRGLRFLNLMIDQERVSENTWIYVPEEKYTFFRIQEPPNWSSALAPPGKTSLSLEIAASPGDELWDLEESALVGRCLEDLAALGLEVRGEVLGHFSFHERHAYPIYDLDYRSNVQSLLAWIDSLDGVVACGRQGLFQYNNSDHAIKMGFEAARHTLGQGEESQEPIRRVSRAAVLFEPSARVTTWRQPGLSAEEG